jgi:hypothetical protein
MGINITLGIFLLMEYTMNGQYLLSQYDFLSLRRRSCMHRNKKGQERISKEPLVYCILKRPARLYDRDILRDVMLACIILYNMIVEDEKQQDIIEENLDLNVAPSSATVQELENFPDQNVPLERVLEKDTSIRDQSAHRRLKNDLIEHI